MITAGLGGGGLEKVVRDLSIRLKQRDFFPAVFTLRKLGVFAQDLLDSGVPVFLCREPDFRVRGAPVRLIRHLSSFSPDIIHAHSGAWFLSSVSRFVLKKPRLMYTEHGRYPPEPWPRAVIERWCAGQTHVVAGVSNHVADYLTEFLGLEERPIVLPNGIDLSRYSQLDPRRVSEVRRRLGVSEGAFVFVSVGRLTDVKNHQALIRALAEVRARQKEVTLFIVGQGPLEKELAGLACQLGIPDAVHLLGFRADVAECLATSDAFVLPSKTEGMPLALIEALAVGLPTIASDVGGISEVLGDPPAGLLIRHSVETELAEAMLRVVSSPTLRAELGKAAKYRARDFGLEALFERYSQVYRHLLD